MTRAIRDYSHWPVYLGGVLREPICVGHVVAR